MVKTVSPPKDPITTALIDKVTASSGGLDVKTTDWKVKPPETSWTVLLVGSFVMIRFVSSPSNEKVWKQVEFPTRHASGKLETCAVIRGVNAANKVNSDAERKCVFIFGEVVDSVSASSAEGRAKKLISDFIQCRRSFFTQSYASGREFWMFFGTKNGLSHVRGRLIGRSESDKSHRVNFDFGPNWPGPSSVLTAFWGRFLEVLKACRKTQ